MERNGAAQNGGEIEQTAGVENVPLGRGRTRRNRGVTMTDVAREAGCSQSTVSFVLNDRDVPISPATRTRVIEAARRLGYLFGSSVKTLGNAVQPETGRSIGFVIDQLSTSPEAVVAIDGLRRGLKGASTLVLAAQSEGDPDTEARIIEAFLRQGVAAIVYATIFTRKVRPPEALLKAPVPAILLNCYTDATVLPSVVPSEIAGGDRAACHLLRHGHRRIATVTGEIWMEAAQDRLTGYRRALATADVSFDPDLVVNGDWSASAGYEATRAFLSLPDRPTAIFCQNDRMAIGCYEALKEAGLAIPDDMSVIGYDDEEIARHLYPRLTTMVLPHRAMGEWAVTRWLEAPDTTAPNPVKLECPLVERASIGVPRGKTPGGF